MVQAQFVDMFIQVYSRSVPKEGRDELSALNLILQDTATEIIDIASIEHTQGVEQADYNEKAAHYAKRLAQVRVALFCFSNVMNPHPTFLRLVRSWWRSMPTQRL